MPRAARSACRPASATSQEDVALSSARLQHHAEDAGAQVGRIVEAGHGQPGLVLVVAAEPLRQAEPPDAAPEGAALAGADHHHSGLQGGGVVGTLVELVLELFEALLARLGTVRAAVEHRPVRVHPVPFGEGDRGVLGSDHLHVHGQRCRLLAHGQRDVEERARAVLLGHAARLLPGGHATAHHPIAALDPAARRRAFEAAHQREACGLEYRRRQPRLEDVRVLGIHVGGDADALEQHGADLGRAQTGDVRGELVEDLVHHVVRLHVPAGGDQGPLDPERPGGFRLLARGQGGRGGQFALRLRRRRGRLREQEREREHHRAPPESNQS